MILTRGSHLLTSITLPDASFALFLIGGMLLKKPTWFENDGRAERPGLKGLAVFGSQLHLSTSHQVAVAHWQF